MNITKKLLFIAVLLLANKAYCQKKSTCTISGNLSFLKEGQKLLIQTFKYGPNFNNEIDSEVYFMSQKAIVHDHRFSFSVPAYTDMMTLLSISGLNDPHNLGGFVAYLIKGGDNVLITDRDGRISFSGIGAKKYAVQYEFEKARLELQNNERPTGNLDAYLPYFRHIDSLCDEQMGLLVLNKYRLTADETDLLKTQLIIQNDYLKFFLINMMGMAFNKVIPMELKKSFSEYINERRKKLGLNSIPSELPITPLYYEYCFERYEFDFKFNHYNSNDQYTNQQIGEAYYNYVISNFRGKRRDGALAYLFYHEKNRSSFKNYSQLLSKAIDVIQTPDFKNLLLRIQRSRIPGVSVFNFELPDTEGKIHALKDYKGKIVYIDMWHYGCGPCRGTYAGLKHVEEYFAGNPNIVFLSICRFTDHKAEWYKGIDEGVYTSKKTINLYMVDAWHDSFSKQINVWGDPETILIDREGKFMENPVRPSEADYNGLIKQLNKALSEQFDGKKESK